MKLPSFFTKFLIYNRFAYNLGDCDALDDECKEREERNRRELSIEFFENDGNASLYRYRPRIAVSFRSAATIQKDPSATMLLPVILLMIAAGRIAFIEGGNVVMNGVVLIIIPIYFYPKFRKFRR